MIPSFNQGRFLGRTLRSVLDQDYPNLELIVVDGGSSDESLAVISSYKSALAWWVSEPDRGQADAINKGFQRSTGELMAWLNSDDVMVPGALWTIALKFLEAPRLDAVYGNRILIDENDLEIGRWVLPFHSGSILRWIDFVPQETLYWRRRAWEAAGSRLDDQLQFAMDWDFLLRMRACRQRIAHIPEFLGMFRVHQQQKTNAWLVEKGGPEIRTLRMRELGFSPHRALVMLRTLPFLIAARTIEVTLLFRRSRTHKESGSNAK